MLNKHKLAILAVSTIASFVMPFMGSSVNIALPTIGKEFSMNAVLVSWVATAYLLSATVFLVPFGRIADMCGRKKIFLYGIFLFTIASVFLSFADSVSILILFRIIQGIGAAMVVGTSVAILTTVFPPEQRGTVLGINTAAVYTGLSLGPVIGGFLTQHFGWRSIFAVNIPLGIIIIAVTLLMIKEEWIFAKGEKFDFTGSIIYVVVFPLIIYGLSIMSTISGLWFVLAGIAGLFVFIKWEMKIEHPVFNINLFKTNTLFRYSNLATLIHYTSASAISFLLSFYLQFIRHLNPKNAGLILMVQPVVQTIVSPFAGRLSDRIEPRIIASIGMSFTTLSLFFFIFLHNDTNMLFIIMNLFIMGFGFALFSSPNTNAVMSSVERKFYGVSAATLGTMRTTGGMISLGFAMLVFSVYIGKVEIIPAYYPLLLESIKVLFIVFSILCFFGIFTSLARGKVQRGS